MWRWLLLSTSPKKQTSAIAVFSINLSLLCHSNPCAALTTTHLLRKVKRPRSLSLDLWYPSPIVPLPTVSLRKKWKSRERGIEKMWTFYTFQAVFLRKKNKLIKIQLSLTYSLLPFQSFYSFKSLTISMKLKGSSRHLWNSDTSDNNAFEEPVTFSPQTSLINAQTVFLVSLFSRFLSN